MKPIIIVLFMALTFMSNVLVASDHDCVYDGCEMFFAEWAAIERGGLNMYSPEFITTRTYTGTVTDATTNETLIGVSVAVVDDHLFGTVTDADG
jgi:hypothetical protein